MSIVINCDLNYLSIVSFFQSATNGTMKRIRDVLERRPKDVLMKDLSKSINRLCSEKIALIAWKTTMNHELRKTAHCTIVDTKESIFPVFVAFGVVKGYQYRYTLNFLWVKNIFILVTSFWLIPVLLNAFFTGNWQYISCTFLEPQNNSGGLCS